MVVGAGVDRNTKAVIPYEITESQAMALGITPDAEPLGCGMMACAYASENGEDVVKITRDIRDARMSWIVMRNPQEWAIPIRGVWTLPNGHYAIVAARATPLEDSDPALVEGIQYLYGIVSRKNIVAESWPFFREAEEANLEDELVEHGPSESLKAHADALAIIDNAVRGFAGLGMAWMDFHKGNWGVYDGRPVVIDLGLSDPLEGPPVRALERAAGRAIPRLCDTDTLSLDQIVTSRESMHSALDNILAGQLSKTEEEPLSVWYLPDEDRYLLVDGHHRMVQHMLVGGGRVPYQIVGRGLVVPVLGSREYKRFRFTNERYGGLEDLADDEILAEAAEIVNAATPTQGASPRPAP